MEANSSGSVDQILFKSWSPKVGVTVEAFSVSLESSLFKSDFPLHISTRKCTAVTCTSYTCIICTNPNIVMYMYIF